jgi:DNA-binding transcriptional regulator GbsR (MarR family)
MSDDVERIRTRFAAAWGRMGAAWGVAPSTAAVHGYLVVHGGPLTEAEIQRALGLSHRATRVALLECEAWGIVERSAEPRRSGRRGPAGRAWVPVDDHWEWFRRVSAARKAREADPVLPVLADCLARAEAIVAVDPAASELRDRLRTMLTFVGKFDRALSATVRADAAALEHLFGAAARLDDRTLERLFAALAVLPEEELARAAGSLAGLSPRLLRRLVGLAAQARLARLPGAGLRDA